MMIRLFVKILLNRNLIFSLSFISAVVHGIMYRSSQQMQLVQRQWTNHVSSLHDHRLTILTLLLFSIFLAILYAAQSQDFKGFYTSSRVSIKHSLPSLFSLLMCFPFELASISCQTQLTPAPRFS